VRHETFSTSEPVTAAVKVTSGDVRIETADTQEATVVLEGLNDPGRRAVEQARVELVGGRLEVEIDRRRGITINIGRGPAVRVHVVVPHGSAAVVETVSADVNLDGQIANVEVKTVSGDARIKDVADDLELKSISGDAKAGRVGGVVDANTVSGDLRFAAAAKGARLKTISGDIDVEAVREGEVRVQSVSGDIRIGIEPGAAVFMDIKSLSGKMTSELELGDEPPVGEERKVEIRGNTISGDVRIGRAAVVAST
jgi:DUF4097 and DUF4098 domain-containing protein YvlB